VASKIWCSIWQEGTKKAKFYRTTIKPAMLYGTEDWPTKGWLVQLIGVPEMCMLR
jgi:hypothetical protein